MALRRQLRLLLAARLLFAPAVADAHGVLQFAAPSPDSGNEPAPRAVTLRFTQAIEPEFSTLTVLDVKGNRVDAGDARQDGKNPASLRVSLKPLQPGTYRVLWRVIAIDGHMTNGAFSFRVLAP